MEKYNPELECINLAEKINQICISKGISYYNLANQAHISTSTLYSILKNKTIPNVYTLFMLCNALDIAIEVLFADDYYLNNNYRTELIISENEKKLLVSYRYLTDEKKELLSIYMQMLQQYKYIEI